MEPNCWHRQPVRAPESASESHGGAVSTKPSLKDPVALRGALTRSRLPPPAGQAGQGRDMSFCPAPVPPAPPVPLRAGHVVLSRSTEAARVSASVAILDRAYGRPAQAVEITDERATMPSVIRIVPG